MLKKAKHGQCFGARLRRRKEIIIEVPEGTPESHEFFSVRPRDKLNRFRDSISPARLTEKGWYKRYTKRVVL